MHSNIGKLLTTKIRNTDLYNFAVHTNTFVSEMFHENAVMKPYIAAVNHAVDTMEKVFSRNLKNPLTVKVQKKHKEREDLLTALRRKIGAGQKIGTNPAMVKASNTLKQEMKDRGWWNYSHLTYAEATVIIRPMLEKMTESPFSSWVSDAEVREILNDLKKTQEEFETLEDNRTEEKINDTTPRMSVARKKLITVVLHMLSVIDFGMSSDPQTWAEIGGYISELITETNAKTRAKQTFSQNREEEPDDEENNTGVEGLIMAESEAHDVLGELACMSMTRDTFMPGRL